MIIGRNTSMRKSLLKFCPPAVLLMLFFLLSGSAFAASTYSAPIARTPRTFHQSCTTALPGHAACFGLISSAPVSVGSISPQASAPGGAAPYAPVNLHNAYNLPFTASIGTPTIAIVDAFNDPNAESDMGTYRSTFGLPACTTANGCFSKVNQNGNAAPLPTSDVGWSEEMSLDLDMASAICQNCKILLVEGNSSSLNDLGIAVNTAAAKGAKVISNSYGTNGEIAGESSLCSAFYSHPNVAVTASSGDNGLSVDFPAVCPHVVAVGGTSLASTGAETAWSGAGGGCSSMIARPSWEVRATTKCSRRAVADVSAVADPNTGVAVFDSFGIAAGFYQFGGTSVSAPIIASVYALAGTLPTDPASLLWGDNETKECLFDVSGETEYAFQTGLGSPHGLGCF